MINSIPALFLTLTRHRQPNMRVSSTSFL